ncbi:WD40-repeat-containing domain protein [Gaertneriomyces semiglobifer]|nr:WD40-repeat-containing domain protein [Gaertneriomyces semiglobifer]
MFARTGLSPFGSTLLHAPSRTPFKIPTAPYKVLDAPELQDDYYLNLLDWSSTDQLAVGLSSCAYLWSAHSGRVTKLCDLGEEDTISSVSWAQKGQVLALGTNTGTIQLWDVRQEKLLRTLADHTKRIGSLVFNNDLLTSGSRDKSILQRDLRAPDVTPIILGGCSAGHTAEICGLKWNWDYTLMASGGNDNQLMLWDPRKGVLPIWKPQNPHGAAVKALSFHPRKRWVLASGGGTADRKIKTWNLQTQSLITEHDTDSQVCNLAWEDNNGHLISTHGYSRNHISVWKPIESGANNQVGFKEYASLTAHTSRVVYLALSPNHETIVTGAGDETLRFWKISEAKERKGPKRDTGTCII